MSTRTRGLASTLIFAGACLAGCASSSPEPGEFTGAKAASTPPEGTRSQEAPPPPEESSWTGAKAAAIPEAKAKAKAGAPGAREPGREEWTGSKAAGIPGDADDGEAADASRTWDEEMRSSAEPIDEIDVVRVLTPRVRPQWVAITQIALRPVDFVGQRVEGRAVVDEVVSDRGFYVGRRPNRVFAVVREDVPRHEMIDIDAGQIIEFEGLLLTPGAADDLTGVLERETMAILREEPAFLALHHRDVRILPVDDDS